MHNQPPYPPGGTLSTGHYEFTEEENRMIAQTGARATLWGFVAIVTGVLALVGLIVSLVFKNELISHGLQANYVTVFVVSLVPIVLTHLVISTLYIGVGKSLRTVVQTQGNDVEHLMQSLDKLGTVFLIEFAIGMLAVVISAGVGLQMAFDNRAAEKAAELAKSTAEAEAIAEAAEAAEAAEGEDDGEDTDTDGEAEGEDDAEDEAEEEEGEAEDEADEDAEAAETDGAAEDGEEDEDGGSGEAEEDEAEDGDAEDEAEDDNAGADDAPTEEPAAG